MAALHRTLLADGAQYDRVRCTLVALCTALADLANHLDILARTEG